MPNAAAYENTTAAPRLWQRVIEGHVARVLLDAAHGADLLVVGSRRHSGFPGALLGSVSQHCAQHSPCPAVIIAGEEQDPQATGEAFDGP